MYATVSLVIGLCLVIAALLYLQKRDKQKPIRTPISNKGSSMTMSSDSSDSSTFNPLGSAKVLPFDVSFENLGLKLHGSGKIVLDGVTGTLKASEVTAIMGPSGSGKTTFLTTLAGRATYGTLMGKTFLNSSEVYLPRYQRLIGFVPQEDVMLREMTVHETLTFAAIAKGDAEMTFQEAAILVDDVMDVLGLTELRDSIIGDENIRGISGGQRKRVNVAIEVVAKPTLLFLDEPTSGLDSTGSMEMLRALRQLATQKHLTIAAVIHQPSWQLTQMFDTLVVLAKGGRTAYLGPTKNIQHYFEDLGFDFPPGYNPVDVALDCVSGTNVSSKSDISHNDLPDIWKTKADNFPIIAMDTSSSLNDSLDFDRELVAMNNHEAISDIPEEELLPAEVGEGTESLLMALLVFFFPPCVIIPHYKYRTQRAQQYSIISYFFGTVLYLSIGIFVMVREVGANDFATVLLTVSTFFSFQSLLGLIGLGILCRRWGKRSINSFAHFCFGAFLGPFFILFMSFLRERSFYMSLAGMGTGNFFLGLGLGMGFLISRNNRVGEILFVVLCATGLVFVAIARSRLNRVVSSERKTTGFLIQLWLQFKRAAIQQSRDLFGISFDLFLPLFTGLSVGILFYGKAWVPPPTESSTWASDATACLDCSNMTALANFPNDATLCHLLYLNKDPFPQLSLMATMGLALVGAASGLRLFGANKANFHREKNAVLRHDASRMGRRCPRNRHEFR